MPASLDQFSQSLRPYQAEAVAFALKLAREQPGSRNLFASPTGTGKGTIELALLRELRAAGLDALILTPSLEVVRGFLERCGATERELNSGEEGLARLGEKIGVLTPIRYRNRVLAGELSSADVFIADEGHHYAESVDTYSLLFTLAPEATWIGFTATPFRGTPKGTKELHDAWGEPWVILDVPQALELGCCQLPYMEVVPLVDDDRVQVRNGQFVVASLDKESSSRLVEVAKLAVAELDRAPTAVVVPSTESAALLCEQDPERLVSVTQATGTRDRKRIYDSARAGDRAVVVVQVLGEGVDFPWLRSLVDCSPTLSPVVWMQRVGRIMRPGEIEPRYLCCCRNLERHAYLMQGAVPLAVLSQAQQAFEKPTERAITRAFGLEALRRHKAVEVPCRGGITAGLWVVYSVDPETAVVTQYAALAHPARPEVIYAERSNQRKEDGTTDWGKWKRTSALPEDLVGYASVPMKSTCSVNQQKWWSDPHRGARRYGLEDRKVNSRTFTVLPILAHLNEVL